jgi:hypothetical protein
MATFLMRWAAIYSESLMIANGEFVGGHQSQAIRTAGRWMRKSIFPMSCSKWTTPDWAVGLPDLPKILQQTGFSGQAS